MYVFRGTHYATISLVYSVRASSNKQTGDLITFAQFEEGNLIENECNAEEEKSISDYDDSDGESKSTNIIKDIRDGSQIHPKIGAREARFKIRDLIRQTQNECKGSELSAKIMCKGLHKLFKDLID